MLSIITNLFKRKTKKTVYPAFTVSEIVIALAVMGVIATTVTSVVYFSKNTSGYKNKDLVATLQNQVVKLNRAYRIALTERDDLDRWVDGSTKMSTTDDKSALFAKVWESYSPSTKSCGETSNGDCFPKATKSSSGTVNYNSNTNYYKIRTTDGASVAFKIDDPTCNGTGITGKEKGVCGEIIVDVNGNKAPNQEGLDTFRLGVYHNGIRTFSAGCADPLNSASVLIATGESCYEDFNVKVCPKKTPFKCRNCSGEVICTTNETECTTVQKNEGCLAETCANGNVSYYIDGKIQCIPENQKACYELIKQNAEYSWDAANKKCLEPNETCAKMGGYWDSGKEICWDSEQHMCETKHMVYDSTRTAGDRCISQNDYCIKAVKNGGLGGWLWSNNVCCTATSVKANTEAVCCSNYISKSGKTDAKTLKRTWWSGVSCCSSTTEEPKDNKTEECCKSDPKGGFWMDGQCFKNGEEHCTTVLNGTWIAAKNQCCTTGVMSNSGCPEVKCYKDAAAKCQDSSPCGTGGKWVKNTCCTSDTSSELCCEGTFKTCNNKNKCFKSDKEYCTTPTADCGIGGWWTPNATGSGEYTTVKGCCTNTNTKVCCDSKAGEMLWWSGSSCCSSENSKECCNSQDNGHAPGYWTGATSGNPSVCWKNASNYCISSDGLKGWVFLEADNTSGDAAKNSIYGVCCTDVPKTAAERTAAGHDKAVRESYSVMTNDSGNGNIKHQGQYDLRLDNKYSELCCINNSSLNGHNRYIWYKDNYGGNSGYCWYDNNEICQAQTDKGDDHGFGGWLYYSNSGTPTCCSDNSYYAKGKTITVRTKTNVSNPTKNSNGTVRGYETYTFDIRNQKDYSSKNCCTVNDGRGGHTRYNWINSYCWDSATEYCTSAIASGASGWYYSGWDSSSQTYNCCTTGKTGNNTILVEPKAGTNAYYITYKNQSDKSTRDCCVNTGTYGRKYDYTVNTGHSAVSVDRRGLWTSKTGSASTGYCWGLKSEYCTSTLGEGLEGWAYDGSSTAGVCCTEKNVTGISTSVYTKNDTSTAMIIKRQDINRNTEKDTNSTKFCCVAANRNPDTGVATSKASTHTRTIWSNNNWDGKNGGFCWLNYDELCQAQTDHTYDHGMGGWLWDSGNSKCCSNHTAMTVSTQNSFANNKETANSATINVLNQSNNSSKACCNVNDSRGGHTRYNWINSYCWDSASEYCKSTNGSGASGWYYSGWDASSQTYNCCTTGKTANGTIAVSPREDKTAYTITYKNQSDKSTRDCCVNTGTYGRKYDYTVNTGHAAVSVDRRGLWTSKTNSASTGYCWGLKSEYCTSTLGEGLEGWAYDGSTTAGVCCTEKDVTGINTSVYTKNDTSTAMVIKRQDINRSTEKDTNSTKFCCVAANRNPDTGVATSKASTHTRTIWSSNNWDGKNGGFCWLNYNELCQTQTDNKYDHGMGGWLWDSGNSKCCSNHTAMTVSTQNSFSNNKETANSATINVLNQSNNSSKTCCTSAETKGGHTRFNWINSYCWDSAAEYCKSTNGSGASGWYYSGWDSGTQTYNCCTTGKTANNNILVEPKSGSSAYYVTYKNQSDKSTKDCCTHNDSGHTRFNWINSYCWDSASEYCTSGGSGASGYAYDSTNKVCCTTGKTANGTITVYPKSGSSSYTITYKNYAASGGTSTEYCCKAAYGNGYKVCNNNCYHSEHESEAACKCYRGANACYGSDGKCYTSSHTNSTACSCFTGGSGCYSGSTCYNSGVNSSEAECKCRKGSGAWYRGSTCCTSDASQTCCRYTWCGGACHSSCAYGCKSDVCCTSLGTQHCCEKNSKVWCGGSCHDSCSYGCKGTTCCTSLGSQHCCEKNSKVWCGGSCHDSCSYGCKSSTCCTSLGSKTCCEGNSKTWCGSSCYDSCPSGCNSSVCCSDTTGSKVGGGTSSSCCTDSAYEWKDGSCVKKPVKLDCKVKFHAQGVGSCSKCTAPDYGQVKIWAEIDGTGCSSRHPRWEYNYTTWEYIVDDVCKTTIVKVSGVASNTMTWSEDATPGSPCGAPYGTGIGSKLSLRLKYKVSTGSDAYETHTPGGGASTSDWKKFQSYP